MAGIARPDYHAPLPPHRALFGMLRHPRTTVRRLIAGSPSVWPLILVMVASWSFSESMVWSDVGGRLRPAMWLSLAVGWFPLIAAAGTAVLALLVTGLGRVLGGRGRLAHLWLAIGWSSAPAALATVLMIAVIALFGSEAWQVAGLVEVSEYVGEEIHWTVTAIASMLSMIGGGIAIVAVSEAHSFSVGRAFVVSLVSGLLVAATPIAVVLLLAQSIA